MCVADMTHRTRKKPSRTFIVDFVYRYAERHREEIASVLQCSESTNYVHGRPIANLFFQKLDVGTNLFQAKMGVDLHWSVLSVDTAVEENTRKVGQGQCHMREAAEFISLSANNGLVATRTLNANAAAILKAVWTMFARIESLLLHCGVVRQNAQYYQIKNFSGNSNSVCSGVTGVVAKGCQTSTSPG